MKYCIKSRYTFVTVITMVQKFAIVAKLCFFLIYYIIMKLRYPISNKRNPSFINLDIQRRFTENDLKTGCKPFIDLLS